MILVDTAAAAVAVAVSPATIRKWASRGRITRAGTDHRRRALYDLQAVMDAAARTT